MNVPGGVYEKSASGATEETPFFGGRMNGPSQISKAGKWLLYVPEGESVQDVFVLPMTGDRKPRWIVRSPSADVEPQLSPDGTFLADANGIGDAVPGEQHRTGNARATILTESGQRNPGSCAGCSARWFGDLQCQRARKGVSITTATFSGEATDYARQIDSRISSWSMAKNWRD